MAFQAAASTSAPMSLQHISAATSELWPSMAAVLRAPWQTRGNVTVGSKQQRRQASKQESSARQEVARPAAPEIPEFMTPVSTQALRKTPRTSTMTGAITARDLISPLSKSSLRHAFPLTRAYSTRSYTSPVTRLGPFTLRPPPTSSRLGFSHTRSLFGTSWGSNGGNNSSSSNRAFLAQMENTANNNPSSAHAQNAFYQALLRNNMPEILVERYNSGRYATNAACDNTFNRALERMGAAEASSVGSLAGRVPAGQSNAGGGMSQEQLQAIGQAVAARSTGRNVSVAKQSVSGGRNEPLYVVVDESMKGTVFRWVKFGFWFLLLGYCALVLITVVIDGMGLLKKVGGVANSEAKPELQTQRFSDVHGCDEAKEELQELVEFLKSPEKFSSLGGKLPKGVLLVGPPGTGKTLLARAVAGEAGVPFFYMSGSEFDEVYVGVGAKRVRDLFQAARSKSPAIIFIDELDAIGSKRHERDAAYAKQTLNQLLTELDGFDQGTGVIILGATNFPQSLDKALTRPGRFDRNVVVPMPDVRGRIAILKHHLRNIKVDLDVDAAIIARGCSGFSGAELENVVNQAAIRASKNKQTKVSIEDLIWAKDRIMMGAERRSAVIQEKDKVMTAYHEGGHALVAMLTEASSPLYKATIMPRGHALGLTQMLPELDKVSESKREMMAQIDVSMAGKVAEELVYGADNVTTGASSDIQAATQIARMMVTQAGMSDVLGNIDLHTDYARLSTETKHAIEAEVRRLVEEGRDRAMKLLVQNRDGLDRLAKALVEYETLGKEEMETVVRGGKLKDKVKADKEAPMKIPDAQATLLAGGGGIAGGLAPATEQEGERGVREEGVR